MGRWRNVIGVWLVFVLLANATIADDDAEEAEAEVEEVNPEPLEYLPRYPHPHHDENDVVDWMPRIIGGVHADIGEFPAKVSVQSRPGAHFCGGTLLDQSHVLTAAHCVTNDQGVVFDPNALRLMGDDLSITSLASRSRQIRFASHIFVHPQYSAWTLANDIAVVRVSVQFTRTTTFHPKNMNQHSPVPDTMCELAGWGLTAEHNNRPSPELMRVDLQVISTHICNDTFSYNGMIQPGQFCAGSMMGGRDSCQGDSGGGLICNGLISGVVSFGFGCGRPRFPGVYIDVSQYIEWILMSINWEGTHESIPRPTTTSSPNDSSKVAVSMLAVLTINLHLITKFLEYL